MFTQEIELKNTIADLLRYRAEILEQCRIIKTAKEKIEQLSNAVYQSAYLDSTFSRNTEYREEDSRKILDIELWGRVIRGCMITATMTAEDKDRYLKKINEEAPAFNEINLEAFSQNILRTLSDSASHTIKQVYKRLIGCRYGNWNDKKYDNLQKINSLFRISDRITKGYCRGWDTHERNIFTDLLTACYILDQKPATDYATSFNALNDTSESGLNTITTPYFVVTCYYNGSQKVVWSRLDILAKLNAYGPEGTELPDIFAKRYKPEHKAA